jgi:hypothetical protein
VGDGGLSSRHLLGCNPKDINHRRFCSLSLKFRTGTPRLIRALASPKPDTVLHMSRQRRFVGAALGRAKADIVSVENRSRLRTQLDLLGRF